MVNYIYANDSYQIKNNELYDSNSKFIALQQNDNLENISNLINTKYIARIEHSWNYTFYFFDQDGKQTYSFDVGNKYELPWVVLSANEKYMALDDGTWIIRNLEIYNFPSFTKIKTLTYKSNYFWIGDYLYFNSLSNETIEGYPADDDSYCYLSRLNLNTKEIEELIKWNECNQYEAKKYTNNLLEIENRYVIDKSDWKERNKWKTRIMEISIIDCSFKKAYINDNLVRFRNAPNLTSDKIYNFSKNDEVTIISRTKQKVNVEGLDDYWYQVQDNKNNIGYVFGSYLNIKY